MGFLWVAADRVVVGGCGEVDRGIGHWRQERPLMSDFGYRPRVGPAGGGQWREAGLGSGRASRR